MARGLETAHGSFPLSSRLVRILRAIVQPFMLSVLDAPQALPLRSTVACQLVRDEHTRHVLTTFEEFAEKLLGCSLIPPALDQDIQHSSMLIDGAPQVGGFALDGQEHFVQMPFIARLRPSSTSLVGILLTERTRPTSHGFIASETPRAAISSSTSRKLNENLK